MKQQIISLLEGKYKNKENYPDTDEAYVDFFNEGIDTAIESVDEIIEIFKNSREYQDLSEKAWKYDELSK